MAPSESSPVAARISNWQAGPRRVAANYVRNVVVSLVWGAARSNPPVAALEAEGITYRAGPADAVGVRLDYDGTKGHAFLELTAEPGLPATVALLRKLRDACNHALAELEKPSQRP